MMTPAEIAQTKRMLTVARREYVHYCTKAQGYIHKQQDPPVGIRMAIEDSQRTIERFEHELIAAGVEVE